MASMTLHCVAKANATLRGLNNRAAVVTTWRGIHRHALEIRITELETADLKCTYVAHRHSRQSRRHGIQFLGNKSREKIEVSLLNKDKWRLANARSIHTDIKEESITLPITTQIHSEPVDWSLGLITKHRDELQTCSWRTEKENDMSYQRMLAPEVLLASVDMTRGSNVEQSKLMLFGFFAVMNSIQNAGTIHPTAI